MVFLHSPRWSSGKLPRSGGVACALPVLDIEAALIARQGGEVDESESYVSFGWISQGRTTRLAP